MQNPRKHKPQKCIFDATFLYGLLLMLPEWMLNSLNGVVSEMNSLQLYVS